MKIVNNEYEKKEANYGTRSIKGCPPPGTTYGDISERAFKGRFYKFLKNFVLFKKKRCYYDNVSAFTLAEVLVTLGIIGVVSAMTVPSLMQNYQRQSYVTQLHKVYNELQQAFVQEMNEANAINLKEAGLTNINTMDEFLQKHFKVVQKCTKHEHCFDINYKNLDGTTVATSSIKWHAGDCAIIASGAEICVDAVNRTYTYNGYSSNWGITFIDVNGQKGPNILGRDAFMLINWDDGVLDTVNASPACRNQGICDGDSLKAIREAAGAACSATKTFTDNQCFGKILNDNWEMTY